MLVSITELKESGNKEFRNKNYKEAIKHYKEALKKVKDVSNQEVNEIKKILTSINNNMSYAYNILGEFQKAIDCACTVLKYCDPANNVAFYRNCRAFIAIKD